jgi:hypothetical protein
VLRLRALKPSSPLSDLLPRATPKFLTSADPPSPQGTAQPTCGEEFGSASPAAEGSSPTSQGTAQPTCGEFGSASPAAEGSSPASQGPLADPLGLRDVLSIVAQFLTASDSRALCCTNLDWYMHGPSILFPHLARVTFDDIAAIEGDSGNRARGARVTASSSSSRSSASRRLPRPDAMLHLARLDLSTFVGTSSPSRPLTKRAGTDSGASPSARLHAVPSSPPRALTSPADPTTTPSRMASAGSVAPPPSSSSADDDDEEDGWLSSLLASRAACSRLRVLRFGSLVPRWMEEGLLRRCGAAASRVDRGGAPRPRPTARTRVTEGGSLQTLSLRGCERTADDALLATAAGCSRLRAVDLNGCWRVTDAGLTSLLEGCPVMEQALLGGVWRVADESLDALPAKWPRLRSLELSAHQRALSARCVAAIVAGCGHLAALRLSAAHFHGDAGQGGWDEILEAAAAPRVRRRLRVLEVEGAAGLTDAVLARFAAACERKGREEEAGEERRAGTGAEEEEEEEEKKADEAEGVVVAATQEDGGKGGRDGGLPRAAPPPPHGPFVLQLHLRCCLNVSQAGAALVGARLTTA